MGAPGADAGGRRIHRAEHDVAEELAVDEPVGAGHGADRVAVAEPTQLLDSGARGAGEPEELEVVGGTGALEKRVEDVLDGLGGLDALQVEGRDAAQGYRRDHPHDAQPHPGGLECLVVVRGLPHGAVGEGKAQAGDDARVTGIAQAGAVGAGGDGAGDGLGVDVAHVRQGQPEGGEQAGDVADVFLDCG